MRYFRYFFLITMAVPVWGLIAYAIYSMPDVATEKRCQDSSSPEQPRYQTTADLLKTVDEITSSSGSGIEKVNADKKLFAEFASDNLKSSMNNFISNGTTSLGNVQHSEKNLLLIWGGNLGGRFNNKLKFSEFRQYRDQNINSELKCEGFKIVDTTQNPDAVLLVYQNVVKVGEYKNLSIDAMRADMHFVYFDLESGSVTNLGSVEGQNPPKTLTVSKNISKIKTSHIEKSASIVKQVKFLKDSLGK